MIERAKVLQRKGDKAIVGLEAKEACSRCFSKSICRLSAENLRRMEVENKIKAEEGSLVEVDIPPVEIIKKSFLFYILPAVFFLVSVSFSLWMGLPQLVALGIGFLCLVGVFFIFDIIYKNNFRKEDSKPQIVKVLKKGDTN